MADLRPTQVQTVATSLTNDVKRNGTDALGATFMGGATGFLDMMMSRVSPLPSDDDTYKVAVKDSTETSRPCVHTARPKCGTDVVESKPSDIRAEAREQIKARVREVMAQDKTALKDDRAVKALKKVAEFLLKADESGAIHLPKELVAKLKEYVEKDPADMHAGEVALMMHDIIDTLKTSNINMTPPAADAELMVWTPEIISALKDLGVHLAVDADKPVTTMEALRVLKALANKSEKSALDALSGKKQEIIDAVDPEHILLGVHEAHIVAAPAETAKEDTEVKATVSADTKTAASEDLAEILVAASAETDEKAPVSEDAEVVTKKAAIKEAVLAQSTSALLEATGEVKATADKVAAAFLGKTSSAATTPAAVAASAEKPLLTETAKAAVSVATPDVAVLATAKETVSASTKAEKTLATPKFAAPSAAMERTFAATTQAAPRSEMLQQAVASGAKSFEAAPLSASAPAPTAAASATTLDASAQRFGLSTANAVAQAAKLPPSTAAQQVMVQIQTKLSTGTTQMSLNLTPVELGRVEVRVTVRHDGAAHTVVTVDHPDTLTLLQKDAAHLERALQQAGLNANQENMSFNLREQRQAQSGFSQKNKRSLRDDDDLKIKEAALNVATDGRIISDTRINYHA